MNTSTLNGLTKFVVDCEESLQRAESAHEEQLSSVMTQLQASETELAKTVAELQHVKCQAVRDSERAKEQFELQSEELERQLRESQEKLQNTESERNILVVSHIEHWCLVVAISYVWCFCLR